MAEREWDLIQAIQNASCIIPGDCSCSQDEDHLCDYCFIEDVLNRVHRYIEARLSVASYSEAVNMASIYPGKDRGMLGLLYAVLGLVGEAGEVANAVKKELRDNQKVVDYINSVIGNMSLEQLRVNTAKILDECGDVMFYNYRVAAEAGALDIRQILGQNMVKINEKRRKILAERKRRDEQE